MARKLDLSARAGGSVAAVDQRLPETAPAEALDGIDALRAESAPLALEKSRELCSHPIGGDHSMCGQNCSWFHGSWQYLLLLGLAASPERNLHFYLKQIRGIASGHGRVLIAGCSDYTMLAIVREAYRGLGVVPEVTVIDRCNTPLYLCRWFADRGGFAVETRQVDLATYEPERPFDIVCTDGLLSNVEPEARADLVGAWHRVLARGGYVVTTNNIRMGPGGRNRRNPAHTVAALCEKAVERKARLPVTLGLSDGALRDLTRGFLAHPRSRSVRSVEELKALFHPDQFDIEQLAFSEIDGNALRDADRRGKIGKTLNARIVARRL